MANIKNEWKVLYGQYPIGTISINEEITNDRICTLTFDSNIERRRTERNAAHIVKCVNSHDELVNSLQRCIDWFYLNGKEKKIPLEGVGAPEFLEEAQYVLDSLVPIKNF